MSEEEAPYDPHQSKRVRIFCKCSDCGNEWTNSWRQSKMERREAEVNCPECESSQVKSFRGKEGE